MIFYKYYSFTENVEIIIKLMIYTSQYSRVDLK